MQRHKYPFTMIYIIIITVLITIVAVLVIYFVVRLVQELSPGHKPSPGLTNLPSTSPSLSSSLTSLTPNPPIPPEIPLTTPLIVTKGSPSPSSPPLPSSSPSSPHQCLVAQDCPPHKVCYDGHCVDCVNDQQCPSNMQCTLNRCTPRKNCLGSQVYHHNQCIIKACEGPEDCSPNETCTAQGQCIPINDPCQRSKDCYNSTLQCSHSQCVQCTSNSDCPGGLCHNGRCYDHCNTNRGCPGGYQCIKGQCSNRQVHSPCQTRGDCEEGLYCVNERCSKTPGSYGSKANADSCGEGLVSVNGICQIP